MQPPVDSCCTDFILAAYFRDREVSIFIKIPSLGPSSLGQKRPPGLVRGGLAGPRFGLCCRVFDIVAHESPLDERRSSAWALGLTEQEAPELNGSRFDGRGAGPCLGARFTEAQLWIWAIR